MRKINILAVTALSLITVYSCSNAAKTDNNSNSIHDSTGTIQAQREDVLMDSAAIAKAWDAYMNPGDMHTVMSESNGKWEAEITFWPEPDAPSTPASKAVVENKMIFGGRYQKSVYNGEMMGMPFEGESILAYDNAKKKFINTWIDNTGTGLMYLEGDYNTAEKALYLTGKMTDPATGKDKSIRQVHKMPDEKKQILEMYDVQDGKEYKSMEIKFSRK